MTKLTLERLSEVRRRMGRGRTSIFNDVRAGLIPPPIHVGRLSCWPAHEIDAIIAARLRGCCEDSIRLLVADLTAKRATIGLEGQSGDAGQQQQAAA